MKYLNNIKQFSFIPHLFLFFTLVVIQSCQTNNQNIKTSLSNSINNLNAVIKKCSGENFKLWDDCHGTRLLENGNKYVGYFRNGNFNGNGQFFFKNGTIYEGGNKDGLADGFGTMSFSNGSKYVGYFKKDKYHGKGKYTYKNGDTYVGQYENGYKNGKGKYTYKDGSFYEGGNKDGLADGFGTISFSNGAKYVGYFKKDKYHGKGKYTYKNGDTFEGNYINGVKDGFGKYTYNDGSKYEGEYKNGKKDGFGIFNIKNGDKFVGNFKNDKRNGKGKYFYKDGSTFEGEYKNSLRDGYGVRTFKNGDKYTGQHIKGKVAGLGKYSFFNGNFYEGMFEDNKYSGEGIFTFADGKTKEGIWKNNKLIENKKISKLYSQKNDNVKKIENEKLYKVGSGSGFAVSKKGYFITNNHVINGCQNIKIHANDKVYLSTLIASDIKNDLALLKSSFKPNFVFPLSSSPAKLMEEVYVAGFPFGHKVSSRIKVTKGIISSLAGLGDDYSRFQIDAAVQPGNSGGPIYDNLGNVVGVTVAKLDYKFSMKNYSTIPELTNFGIKSSMLRSFLSASNIEFRDSVSKQISNLGEMIQNGSFYISCFMTKAKYNEYKNKKVLLDENNIFNIQ